MQREYDLEFRFLLSTAHFGAVILAVPLHWLNRLLNDPEPTLRQDLYTYAKLFNLVVHYEMGNNELVEYISRSTKRFLTKRSRAYGVEAALVEHVRKLAKTSGAEAKHGLFVSLEAKLNELMEDPDESTVLKYFNICAWVRSKVQGITMAEAVRKSRCLKEDELGFSKLGMSTCARAELFSDYSKPERISFFSTTLNSVRRLAWCWARARHVVHATVHGHGLPLAFGSDVVRVHAMAHQVVHCAFLPVRRSIPSCTYHHHGCPYVIPVQSRTWGCP
ncbi:MAG: hypothetical protein IPL86_07275 [Flavobacteriales bacterium]|nr:hypothetical protein [Flavobacteriales bacterium]